MSEVFTLLESPYVHISVQFIADYIPVKRFRMYVLCENLLAISLTKMRVYLKSYHQRCAGVLGGLADFPGVWLQCLSRSHFNGCGKTRSHHFLMDYHGFNSTSITAMTNILILLCAVSFEVRNDPFTI